MHYRRSVRIQTENLRPLPFKKPVFVVSTVKNELTPEEKSQGWKLLFDGVSSTGWESARKEIRPQENPIMNRLETLDVRCWVDCRSRKSENDELVLGSVGLG